MAAADSIPTPRLAYPCVMRRHEMQTAFSLPHQKRRQFDVMTELHGTTFVATPQGWILVVANSGSKLSLTYLLDPQTTSRVVLPELEDDDLPEQRKCVLSGNDATAEGCGVLVLDMTSPAMWFCRVGGSRWSRHGYDIGCYNLPESYCPVPKKCNIFDIATQTELSSVGCLAQLIRGSIPGARTGRVGSPPCFAVDGRFFFFESDTSSEVGTLNFTDDGPEPEARMGAIAVPSLDGDFYGDRQQMSAVLTYLLESCGDLYLASISFYGSCYDRPGTVRVYKMDFSASAWRGTEDIGDRAFLLGSPNFGASCSASGHGLMANCLYWVNLFHEEGNDLHVYDVKDGRLEIIEMFSEDTSAAQRPFWIVPAAD